MMLSRKLKEPLKSPWPGKSMNSIVEKASLTLFHDCNQSLHETYQGQGWIWRNEQRTSYLGLGFSPMPCRSVKTPTEELLGELVELLKSWTHPEEQNYQGYLCLGLTGACPQGLCQQKSLWETNSLQNLWHSFAMKIVTVIKGENLVPYLTRKLQESKPVDMASVITYVTVSWKCWNWRISKNFWRLLKEESHQPHPRSVAVYKLIRPARDSPSVYRPVSPVSYWELSWKRWGQNGCGYSSLPTVLHPRLQRLAISTGLNL